MFQTGDCALLLMRDTPLRRLTIRWLKLRYNLETVIADNLMEVVTLVSNVENHFDVFILDEEIAGLAATSHVFRIIRERFIHAGTIFLSDLPELIHPRWGGRFKESASFNLSYVRETQIQKRMKKTTLLSEALLSAHNLNEAHHNLCAAFRQTLGVDNAIFAMLQDNGGGRHSAVTVTDLLFQEGGVLSLENSAVLKRMARYCKPAHYPDLEADPAFSEEIRRKFGSRYRSLLLVPVPVRENCLGFFCLCHQKRRRMFTLLDLDLCTRLADVAGGIFLYLFALERGKMLKRPNIEEESRSLFPRR